MLSPSLSQSQNASGLLFPESRERLEAALAPLWDRFQPAQPPKSLPTNWRTRVPALFGDYFWFPFSPPHEALWEWENAIHADSAPRSFVALWPRGRGKSTTVEAAVADLAIRGARTYCLYVCGTQDQADKHVQTIARMLESERVAVYAPTIGTPKVSQNGNKTWNRKMVTTATGFTVEAIGLDKAVRGQKIDWARPDLIVFDDIDEEHDTDLTVKKKEESFTNSILPAGSTNCAQLFAQNLIHANSIANKLGKAPNQEGAAHYMMNRIVSGPFMAVEGLKYAQRQTGDLWEWVITAGESLWQGYDLTICERELNRFGPTSFNRELQNDVDGDVTGALMTAEDFERTRRTLEQLPDLARVAVAVDPPGGATECGIVCGGRAKIGKDWHGYVIEDATMPKGVKPEAWALAVLKCYVRNQADVIFVERNYGGDMVSSTIRQTKWIDEDSDKVIVDGAKVNIEEVVATRGKLVRAEPVATVFQQGRGHHVGIFEPLEKEWRQYVPGVKDSPNRLDAAVWLFTGLELVGEQAALQTVPQAAKLYNSREQERSTRGNDRRGLYGSRT